MRVPVITKRALRKWSIAVAAVAAVLYYSWPLGNVLNPVANRGLASNLEALHQPYNWLFILLDIASGAAVCLVMVLLSTGYRQRRHWLLTWSISGYGAFGLLTLIDAVLPIDCVDVEQRCGALIGHPLIILHGLASLGSIGFLTIGIVATWFVILTGDRYSLLLRALLTLIFVSWMAFGVVTGVLIVLGRSSALSQHLFLTVCSFWIILFPYLVFRTDYWRGQALTLKKLDAIKLWR